MLMEAAVLLTEIATRGTSACTTASNPYSYFTAPEWREPPADLIADALTAAGDAAVQVSDDARTAARAILNLLADLPDPTVGVEGKELALEWYKDKSNVAVVAVDGRSINWAILVAGTPVKGKEPFKNAVPSEAFEAVRAVAVG